MLHPLKETNGTVLLDLPVPERCSWSLIDLIAATQAVRTALTSSGELQLRCVAMVTCGSKVVDAGNIVFIEVIICRRISCSVELACGQYQSEIVIRSKVLKSSGVVYLVFRVCERGEENA